MFSLPRQPPLTEVCLSLLCNTLLLLSTTTTMATDAAQIKSEIARLTGKPSSPSIHYIHTHWLESSLDKPTQIQVRNRKSYNSALSQLSTTKHKHLMATPEQHLHQPELQAPAEQVYSSC
jgi:hypothetical protein